VRRLPRLLAAGLLASALPGCPFSDQYYVDPNAGSAGAALGGSGGAGMDGSGGTALVAESGGTAGAGVAIGGTGGSGGNATPAGGTGGDEMMGGVGASGGEPEGGTGGSSPTCEPAPEVCDGISNDCDREIDEGAVCPPKCKARFFGGHTYLLCVPDNEVTYLEASDACFSADEESGLDFRLLLVRIGSAEEQAFIQSWLDMRGGPNGLVWTGGNDSVSEGEWMWGQGPTAIQFFVGDAGGGGTPYMDQYNDFEPGQPNSSNGADEDCMVLNPDAEWQWNDVACSGAQVAFICEQEP
jgi:hypothetical protein